MHQGPRSLYVAAPASHPRDGCVRSCPGEWFTIP
jgi:hypothetical protein